MIQLQNGWGQFTPKNWGQFAPEYWGQFHAEKGGLFGRNFQLAQSDAGKEFTMECRWKNSKENHKSGPWSAAVKVMVIW